MRFAAVCFSLFRCDVEHLHVIIMDAWLFQIKVMWLSFVNIKHDQRTDMYCVTSNV